MRKKDDETFFFPSSSPGQSNEQAALDDSKHPVMDDPFF
jgi:hypothetical protein